MGTGKLIYRKMAAASYLTYLPKLLFNSMLREKGKHLLLTVKTPGRRFQAQLTSGLQGSRLPR